MVRRSLMAAVLLASASPLAAQEAWTWSPDRPDALAPIGVRGAGVLEQGGFSLTYRLVQTKHRGIWERKDTIPVAQTLSRFQVAPTTRTRQDHNVTVAAGITDRLTLTASGEFSLLDREHFTSGGIYYSTGVEGLGDATAAALYEFLRSGAYRSQVELGVVIPIGTSSTSAVTPLSSPAEEELPYDMRPGSGSFAVAPGIMAEVQNETSSLGAQFRARINVGKKNGYQLGDVYEANGWAARTFGDHVSLSLGARWQSWGRIEGADPDLVTTQDPGMDWFGFGGQRLDVPVGLNLVLPGESVVGGHRLSLEVGYPVHHDYDGPQLGMDWDLTVGYQVGF